MLLFVTTADGITSCSRPFSLYRLRLRYADEPAVSSAALKRKEGGGQHQQNLATRQQQKLETIYILEPHELDNQRLSLVADKVSQAVGSGQLEIAPSPDPT